MLPDLATREDFDADAAPYYARRDGVGFVLMAGVGAGLLVVFGTDWQATGAAFWSQMGQALIVGLCLGLPIGLLGTLAERHERKVKVWRRLDRIFRWDPALVPPAPPGATHRLVCAAIVSLRKAAGGSLYVCRDGLVFQPHYPRRRWPWRRVQAPQALRIGPPRTIVLETGLLRRGHWLLRPLDEPRRQVVLCTWQGGSVVLSVPRLDLVLPRLQRCVDTLRATESAAG